MPRLMLLRHAKSSWAEPSTTDFERPLAPRGKRAAPLIGHYMDGHGYLPDRILCSTALRTRQTLAYLLPYFDEEHEARFRRSLYDTLDDDYLDIIARHCEGARTLLVIGHNPATQETARALARRGEKEALDKLEEGFPTAALAVIDFEGDDWGGLGEREGHLVDFVRPRELETKNQTQTN